MVRLTESIVYSRTKFTAESVRKLNLWGCDIDDINLCSEMVNLQILSLSMNKVKCLKALKNCARLEELYLRKNEISNLNELEHLKDLKSLKILWIDGNPCTADNMHRAKVLKILPGLTRLDDKRKVNLYSTYIPAVSVEEILNARTDQEVTIITGSDGNNELIETRRVVDTIMPNIPRIQQLITNYIMDQNPVCISQEQPSKLMITSSSDGINEIGNSNLRNSDECRDLSLQMSPPFENESNNAMFRSMYERPKTSQAIINTSQRSSSLPRHQRKSRIISAIGVLLDELDASGLRDVIEEAQCRIKKLR
ncbi:unnamed protein product [Thelazia callipaeda]|uniref:Protein C21orf2 n=1 Tax=Thelazia callipaeda TaxID=103827 RepID=A0A0N5CVK1_THECL|nr:unnamed protein product [Thelazia callipaeda]